MKLAISRAARTDLVSTWQYSAAHWGEAHADLYIDLLRTRFAWLAENHTLCPVRSEIGEEFRAWKEKSHVIWFQVRENRLEILRVLHQRMDPRDRV